MKVWMNALEKIACGREDGYRSSCFADFRQVTPSDGRPGTLDRQSKGVDLPNGP
jgi:hypothetical protein